VVVCINKGLKDFHVVFKDGMGKRIPNLSEKISEAVLQKCHSPFVTRTESSIIIAIEKPVVDNRLK
jgi:hypothetical protein